MGNIKYKMCKDSFYFFSIKKGQNFKKVLGLGLGLVLVNNGNVRVVYLGAVQLLRILFLMCLVIIF